MGFFNSFIKELIDEGHTVDIATNDIESKVPECYYKWNCNVYSIDCTRSPFHKGNITAIKQIKKIVQNGQYDIVHCHTPIAAACTRIACKNLRKTGVKVIYTAHGFHFYKGAPLLNWIVYYPIEKICSHFTDVLITINKEDYEFAKKRMNAKNIEYVPGVGIDVEKFANVEVDRAAKRAELGIPEQVILLLSVGELNKNKNHQIVIRALAEMNDINVHYAIAGRGTEKDNLLKLAQSLGVSEQVHLLGQRSDVAELYKISDIYVHPSLREGLPVALMEAMASGLPCIVSFIRGNVDLINDNGGKLFDPYEVDTLICELNNLLVADIKKMGFQNQKKIQKFSFEKINKFILKIYKEVF